MYETFPSSDDLNRRAARDIMTFVVNNPDQIHEAAMNGESWMLSAEPVVSKPIEGISLLIDCDAGRGRFELTGSIELNEPYDLGYRGGNGKKIVEEVFENHQTDERPPYEHNGAYVIAGEHETSSVLSYRHNESTIYVSSSRTAGGKYSNQLKILQEQPKLNPASIDASIADVSGLMSETIDRIYTNSGYFALIRTIILGPPRFLGASVLRPPYHR